MNSKNVKQILYNLGADICGIAPIERFTDAPEGFGPADTLPSCKSVVIFGKKFLRGTLECKNTIPYTIVRNNLSVMLDIMSVDFCDIMEDNNVTAVPIGTIGPTLLDKKTSRFRNILSVKHAAVLAGLGYIGKNSLLITAEFGNMVWLSGALLSIELEGDEVIEKECPGGCSICIDNCPVKAIKKDSREIDQLACYEHAFRTGEGEDFYFKCNKCRTLCPNCLGSSNYNA